MLLSYIKKHIFLHIVLFALYSALFFLMLIVIGEIIYENGYDRLSVKDTTYTFRLYTDDRQKIESVLKSVEDYSDICIVSEEDNYEIVSFYTPVSSLRNSTTDFGEIHPGEIACNSDMFFYDTFGDEIDLEENTLLLGDRKYNIVGIKNIPLHLPIDLSQILYFNADDFWDLRSSDNILLSIYKENRMNDEELESIKKAISDNGITSASYMPDRITFTSKVLNSDEVRLIYIMALLTCICFSRLLLILVDNRKEEYMIMRYCGAPKRAIVRYVLDHVLFVLIGSAFLGLLFYWAARMLFNDFIVYRPGSIVFYLLLFAGYFSASLITSGIILLAKAAKDGY